MAATPDFAFSTRLSVRFRDCDPMGHVNNAVYLTYLEVARVEFWREATGTNLGPGLSIILARVACNYRAPAKPGDELEVRCNIGDIGRSSFTMVYEVVNAATGQLLADAESVQVAYDYSANRSVPIPADVRPVLERYRVGAGA